MLGHLHFLAFQYQFQLKGKGSNNNASSVNITFSPTSLMTCTFNSSQSNSFIFSIHCGNVIADNYSLFYQFLRQQISSVHVRTCINLPQFVLLVVTVSLIVAFSYFLIFSEISSIRPINTYFPGSR